MRYVADNDDFKDARDQQTSQLPYPKAPKDAPKAPKDAPRDKQTSQPEAPVSPEAVLKPLLASRYYSVIKATIRVIKATSKTLLSKVMQAMQAMQATTKLITASSKLIGSSKVVARVFGGRTAIREPVRPVRVVLRLSSSSVFVLLYQ